MKTIDLLKQYAETHNLPLETVKSRFKRRKLVQVGDALVEPEPEKGSKGSVAQVQKVQVANEEGSKVQVEPEKLNPEPEVNPKKVQGSKPEPANLDLEITALRDRVDSLESVVAALQSAVQILQSAPTHYAPALLPPVGELRFTPGLPIVEGGIDGRFIPPPDSGLKPDFVVEYEGPPKSQGGPSQVQIVVPERGARPEPGPDELRRKEFYDESMSALLKARKPAYSIHVDRIVKAKGIEPNANGYFTRAQVAEVAA